MTLLTSLLMIWCQRKKTTKTRQKVARETEKPQSNETIKPDYAVTPGWPVQFPLFLPTTLHVQPSHLELEGIQSMLQESKRVLQRFQKQEENMLQYKAATSPSEDSNQKDKEFSPTKDDYFKDFGVEPGLGNHEEFDTTLDHQINVEHSRSDALNGLSASKSATNASEDSNQKNKKFGTAEDEYLKDASVEPGIRNHKKLEPAT
ncbi:hypothetical protein JHK86_001506 [Glycine max]|nr:hypothetical protein JHK86_001506 [Glycine max]